MSWTLNVAEKGSMARTLSQILARIGGGGDVIQRNDDTIEFEYLDGTEAHHMVFISVDGHLKVHGFEDHYRKWDNCDPAELLDLHVNVEKSISKERTAIKDQLVKQVQKCQRLILWLDCDREGENIALEVKEVCRSVKPDLKVKRARFSALTDTDIRESMKKLDKLNENLARAVDARKEIDLRFPTLGFIVERYWQRQAHKEKKFWTINCTSPNTIDGGTTSFSWRGKDLYNQTYVNGIYELCCEEPTGIVKDVRTQKKMKRPPFPLSTLELQKRASMYFRMSSDRTMKAAEVLYLAGVISYPRTEVDSFSDNTDLKAIVMHQINHPRWGIYAKQLLHPDGGHWSNPRNGGHVDGALTPIHPIKNLPDGHWSQDQQNIYELVVRHFLACVSKHAVGAKTTIDVEIAGECFSATWCVILKGNYLDVYSFEPWGGSIVPTYTIQHQLTSTVLNIDSRTTIAPPLLSEADLLSSMRNAGIGTDATRHGHIQKLLDQGYATRDSNLCFSPTKLGMVLIMGYKDMGYEFWKPNLRSIMESQIAEISTGVSKSLVLGRCLDRMKTVFLDVRQNKAKLLEPMRMLSERSNKSCDDIRTVIAKVGLCDLCNVSDMVLDRDLNGVFMVGCLGFPSCRYVMWLSKSITEAVVTTEDCRSCTQGCVKMIECKFQNMEGSEICDVRQVCIRGCNAPPREQLEIGSRSHAGTSGGGQGAVDPSSRSRTANSRSNSCTYCRQTSHSSDSCPYRPGSSHGARSETYRNVSGSTMCSLCGAQCVVRTATTEHNRGRKFLKCLSEGCNFYAWENNLDNGGDRRRG